MFMGFSGRQLLGIAVVSVASAALWTTLTKKTSK